MGKGLKDPNLKVLNSFSKRPALLASRIHLEVNTYYWLLVRAVQSASYRKGTKCRRFIFEVSRLLDLATWILRPRRKDSVASMLRIIPTARWVFPSPLRGKKVLPPKPQPTKNTVSDTDWYSSSDGISHPPGSDYSDSEGQMTDGSVGTHQMISDPYGSDGDY